MLEHDSSTLAGFHGLQEIPNQVSNFCCKFSDHIIHGLHVQELENGNGYVGIQYLAWGPSRILSLIRISSSVFNGNLF